jgi:hypothetical protein
LFGLAKKRLSPLGLIVAREHQRQHGYGRISWATVEDKVVRLGAHDSTEVQTVGGTMGADLSFGEAVQVMEGSRKVLAVVGGRILDEGPSSTGACRGQLPVLACGRQGGEIHKDAIQDGLAAGMGIHTTSPKGWLDCITKRPSEALRCVRHRE